MAEMSALPVACLYVHVPFCARKCSYCAFYSESSSGELIDRYVGALIRELELVAADLRPRTIYFGGGTPSLLNLRQWEQILDAMERLRLGGAREWTVECNPATVSLEKARLLRSGGVNRMSMGVQSLNASLLDRLGRVHTREMAFKSFDTLRQAGFDNLNLDLMFAIPGQTLEVWRETLREATTMGSEHLSSYEVIYEEDTALYDQLQAGKVNADEDLACSMYEELVDCATTAGIEQYEVANFARPRAFREPRCNRDGPRSLSLSPAAAPARRQRGESEGERVPKAGEGLVHGPDARREAVAPMNAQPATPNLPGFACHHNVNYWRGGSFYGLGPSATSYVRGVRTKTWSNTQLYCEQLEQRQRAFESHEELAPLARAGETAAFGLRMVEGWPFEEFRQVTGYDLRREWVSDMSQLVEQGRGRILPDRFQLTREGLRFADAAAQLFLR
jgi:coproporphyrinogen III oxidase-like Fe-S oxidoreductase